MADENDLRGWMEKRFDRIDDKLERETQNLSEEIVSTRHGWKQVAQQMTEQLVMLTQIVNTHQGQLGGIEEWRKEGGPLDARFRRHDARLVKGESWRNRFAGGLAVLTFLFPVTVGVIVAVLR